MIAPTIRNQWREKTALKIKKSKGKKFSWKREFFFRFIFLLESKKGWSVSKGVPPLKACHRFWEKTHGLEETDQGCTAIWHQSSECSTSFLPFNLFFWQKAMRNKQAPWTYAFTISGKKKPVPFYTVDFTDFCSLSL